MHFELEPRHTRCACAIQRGQLLPFHFREIAIDRFPFVLDSQQLRHRLVEIKNAPLFIDHQHTVLDRVEQRLEKVPLARQTTHHRLQPVRIQPPDAPQHFIEEVGFRGHAANQPSGISRSVLDCGSPLPFSESKRFL